MMRRALLLGLAALLAGCPDSVGDGHGGGTGASIAAPTSLSGTPGAGRVNLSWVDTSSNETNFRLEVHTRPFGPPPYTDVLYLPANSTAYAYSGPPNTLLHFRIYAITASEQSAPSNVISVTTPNVPLPPTFFTSLPISYNQVELQWVAPGNQTGYRIELWDANTSTWTGVTTLSGGFTSYVYPLPYTIPTQLPVHRIFAVNALGDSQPVVASGMTFWTSNSSWAGPAPFPGTWNYGGRTSIAAGPTGELHVSHYNWDFLNVWYARFSPAGMVLDNVQIDSPMGQPDAEGFDGTSLALDGSGKVHVAANLHYQDFLQYITNESGSWVATTVDFGGGKHPQLKIAPNGSIYIAYQISNTLNLAYKAPGMPWSLSNVPIGVKADHVHSLAIDGSGGVHVILVQDNGSTLWHWSQAGGFEQISTTGSFEHTSAAFDGSGVLHVAYNDAVTGSLMVANNAGGAWTRQVAHAHSRGNLGRHNSMVIDEYGTVCVSYYDAIWGNLWQARKAAGSSGFSTMLVHFNGDVGRHTSTAWDGFNVATSYYDVSQGKLIVVKVAQ